MQFLEIFFLEENYRAVHFFAMYPKSFISAYYAKSANKKRGGRETERSQISKKQFSLDDANP